MKSTFAALCLATMAVISAGAMAQEPSENISSSRHGNLARAQDLSRQAFDTLTAAQETNDFDLGGHAGRAKELLRQANNEMKLAAEAANNRR